MGKISSLLLAGIVAMAISGGYTAYLFYQQSALGSEGRKVENQLQEKQNIMTQFQGNALEQAISAKQVAEELNKNNILWSQVIKDIRRTIPKGKGSDSLVEVLSYSGNGGSDISMSVKTMSTSNEPYIDVAKVIQSFDESNYFEDIFVPSISSGIDQGGAEVLTFNISARYTGGELTIK